MFKTAKFTIDDSGRSIDLQKLHTCLDRMSHRTSRLNVDKDKIHTAIYTKFTKPAAFDILGLDWKLDEVVNGRMNGHSLVSSIDVFTTRQLGIHVMWNIDLYQMQEGERYVFISNRTMNTESKHEYIELTLGFEGDENKLLAMLSELDIEHELDERI